MVWVSIRGLPEPVEKLPSRTMGPVLLAAICSAGSPIDGFNDPIGDTTWGEPKSALELDRIRALVPDGPSGYLPPGP